MHASTDKLGNPNPMQGRSLAAAALSHESHCGPCRDIQGEALQDLELRTGRVGEGDISQLDVALNAVGPLALLLIIYIRLPAELKVFACRRNLGGQTEPAALKSPLLCRWERG